MSILNNYRINFFGGATANPCTANNDDRGEFMVDPIAGKLAPNLIDKTDEEAQNILKKNPGWNYFGDHRFAFSGVSITSGGYPQEVQRNFSLSQQEVHLLGHQEGGNSRESYPVLVDLDSTGVSVTQMFIGGFRIGPREKPLLMITEDTECYSRYWGGNQHGIKSLGGDSFGGLATIFQVSFSKESITSYDPTNPALKELVDEARKHKGITVRFTFFEVIPGKTEKEVQADYKANDPSPNPVKGFLIGSIGIWQEGEAATCMPGRAMIGELKPKLKQRPLGVVYTQWNDDAKLMSFNMANAFTKPGRSRLDRNKIKDIKPTKAPSSISLAVKEEGKMTVIFEIPYDNATYHLTGGIVDVPLSNSQRERIVGRDLYIVDPNSNNSVLLSETPYRIISDFRGIYYDHGESASHRFRITKWGRPVTTPIEIQLTQVGSGTLQDKYCNYLDLNATISDEEGNEIHFSRSGACGQNQTLIYSSSINVNPNSDGQFKLSSKWRAAGIKQLDFAIDGNKVYHAVIRSYPNDDYSAQRDPSGNYSWELVYNEVLRYYYVVFPAMNVRIPLNQEKVVCVFENVSIRKRISRQLISTSIAMPITRDMSRGKRELLTTFLENYNSPKGEVTT